MTSYMITAEPFLDQKNRCYKKIIVINQKPSGSLGQHVIRMQTPQLSPFSGQGPCTRKDSCKFVFKGGHGCDGLMEVDDLPILFNLVMSNGYSIDTGLTRMMNKSNVKVGSDLLCFITG